MRKQKQLGILTGANFSLKKNNRKARLLVKSITPTIPLLSNGLPTFSAKCAEDSPFNPEMIKGLRLSRGMQKIINLVGRFKV